MLSKIWLLRSIACLLIKNANFQALPEPHVSAGLLALQVLRATLSENYYE